MVNKESMLLALGVGEGRVDREHRGSGGIGGERNVLRG